MPEKSRPAEIPCRMYLDAMPLQNPDPHVAGRLVAVDEENFLVRKNWLATKWRRAIHTPPPKGMRNWADCPPEGRGGQQKRSQRPRLLLSNGGCLIQIGDG